MHPLAIPPRECLSFPIRLVGEKGFYNLNGAPVHIMPPATLEVVRGQLA